MEISLSDKNSKKKSLYQIPVEGGFTILLFISEASVNYKLWTKQIFWASRVTLQSNDKPTLGYDELVNILCSLERILMVLHRFPLACFKTRDQLVLPSYIMAIDRGVCQFCTEYWESNCAKWDHYSQVTAYKKVEAIMIACRSWLLKSCQLSSAVASSMIKSNEIFNWILDRPRPAKITYCYQFRDNFWIYSQAQKSPGYQQPKMDQALLKSFISLGMPPSLNQNLTHLFLQIVAAWILLLCT